MGIADTHAIIVEKFLWVVFYYIDQTGLGSKGSYFTQLMDKLDKCWEGSEIKNRN